MSQDFQPSNDLERVLLDAQEGRATPQQFIDTLMGSEVFMPVYEKHQIGGFVSSQQAQPLTLTDDDSGEKVLVLFTGPERAKAFVRDFPGYEGGLVAEFTWVLERLGVGFGISLNPGLEVGIDLEAQTIQQITQGDG